MTDNLHHIILPSSYYSPFIISSSLHQIAQSEAYLNSHQWVNYWLHTGHLNIKGLKMSKSLKNFTTIRAALSSHSSRQLRFCFLLHKYNATMDYSDGTMTQAVNIEKIFTGDW